MVFNFMEKEAMTKIRTLMMVALVAGLAAVWTLPNQAADDKKKGSNTATPEAAAAVKPSASAQSVADLALAHSLIQYGRKNKSPEALLTAAQIIAKTPAEELKEKGKKEGKGDDKTPGQRADNSPKALVAEAKAMSKAAHVASLADATSKLIEETPRGAVGGAKAGSETLAPGFNCTHTATFRGNEVAEVAVVGNGESRLDMYVYDEDGNLIRSCEGAGDRCLARWVPKWTGIFRVKVVNRGPGVNHYGIASN